MFHELQLRHVAPWSETQKCSPFIEKCQSNSLLCKVWSARFDSPWPVEIPELLWILLKLWQLWQRYGLQDRKVRHLENMRKNITKFTSWKHVSNHWSVPFFWVFLLFHSQFPENSSHAKSFHHRSLNRRRPWVVLPPNHLPRLRGHLHPARDRIGRWGCRENPVAASLSGRSVSASPGSYRTIKINRCLDHRNISKQIKTLFASICLIFLKHCQHDIYHHLLNEAKFTSKASFSILRNWSTASKRMLGRLSREVPPN